MVSAEIKIMLYACLDIKIDYASAAIRFSVRMHKVPVMLSEFVRIIA